MLSMSCSLDKNASISSSTCLANNVEETDHLMEQDKESHRVSSNSSSSPSTHFCLMTKASKVSPTLNPNISNDYEDSEDEDNSFDSLMNKSGMVQRALHKNKNAHDSFIP